MGSFVRSNGLFRQAHLVLLLSLTAFSVSAQSIKFNEQAAQSRICQVNQAQVEFYKVHGRYTANFSELVNGGFLQENYNQDLDGYLFNLTDGGSTVNQTYDLTVEPVEVGTTGIRYFYTNNSGRTRYEDGCCISQESRPLPETSCPIGAIEENEARIIDRLCALRVAMARYKASSATTYNDPYILEAGYGLGSNQWFPLLGCSWVDGDDGYRYLFGASDEEYILVATPVLPETTGNREFYLDESGVIRQGAPGETGPQSPALTDTCPEPPDCTTVPIRSEKAAIEEHLCTLYNAQQAYFAQNGFYAESMPDLGLEINFEERVDGYLYLVNSSEQDSFWIDADPEEQDVTGNWFFYLDETGVIRYGENGPAYVDSPVFGTVCEASYVTFPTAENDSLLTLAGADTVEENEMLTLAVDHSSGSAIWFKNGRKLLLQSALTLEHRAVLTDSGNYRAIVVDGNAVRLSESINVAVAPKQDFFATAAAQQCTATALPIPDGDSNGTNVSVEFAGVNRTIDYLWVKVSIEHGFAGDLKFVLTHEETGTSVVLLDQLCQYYDSPNNQYTSPPCLSDNLEIVFKSDTPDQGESLCDICNKGANDVAQYPVQNENLPYHPSLLGVSPQGDLRDFFGEPMAGTWTLTVADMEERDTGALLSWCIGFDGEPVPQVTHSADLNGDFSFSLSELLRVVQLYNMGAYSCAPQAKALSAEDGYIALPPGDTSCTPHDADFNQQDWQIDLTELLRVIQLYRFGNYYYCPILGEGNFCPGTEAN